MAEEFRKCASSLFNSKTIADMLNRKPAVVFGPLEFILALCSAVPTMDLFHYVLRALGPRKDVCRSSRDAEALARLTSLPGHACAWDKFLSLHPLPLGRLHACYIEWYYKRRTSGECCQLSTITVAEFRYLVFKNFSDSSVQSTSSSSRIERPAAAQGNSFQQKQRSSQGQLAQNQTQVTGPPAQTTSSPSFAQSNTNVEQREQMSKHNSHENSRSGRRYDAKKSSTNKYRPQSTTTVSAIQVSHEGSTLSSAENPQHLVVASGAVSNQGRPPQ